MSRLAMTVSLLIAVLALAPAARAGGVVGDWLSRDGDAVVRIAPCGDTLCGTFVWLKDSVDAATGRPEVDEHNPNPALRGRPLVGMRFLGGFKPTGEGRWTDGRIYDPESGRTYHAKLSPAPNGRLKLEGCLGPFCRGQIWAPAPAFAYGGQSEFSAR
jgi:uncharacterized protein (DUF2147 family)